MKASLLATTAVAGILAIDGAGLSAAFAAGTDEIVVTARKRAELLSDVPASASALTGDQLLEQGGLKDLRDLQYAVSGFSLIDTGGFNTEPSIRGSGASTAQVTGVDSPLGILRDGAQITGGNFGGRSFSRFDLFDLERIEIVRGPQGALYGVNAVGGVINAISSRPKNETSVLVEGGYNFTLDGQRLQTIVNTPIVDDTLLLRAGIDLEDNKKGHVKNRFLGGYSDDKNDYKGLRGALTYKPVNDLDITAIVDYSREYTPSQRADAILPGQPDVDGPYVNEKDTKEHERREMFSATLIGELALDIGTLSSTTHWRERQTDTTLDFDWTNPVPAQRTIAPMGCAPGNCTATFIDQTTVLSTDVQLQSPGEDRLTWMVGADARWIDNQFSSQMAGIPIAMGMNSNVYNRSYTQEFSAGAFVQAGFRFTPALKFDAAVRYGHDERDFNIFNLDGFGAITDSRTFDTKKFDNVTPSATLSYQFPDRTLLYVAYAQGYRAGGFNSNQGDPADIVPVKQTFEEEKAQDIDIGVKHRFGPFQTALTYYYVEYKDLLVTTFTVPAPAGLTQSFRINGGDAFFQGVDAEISGRVDVPAIGGSLSVTASGAWGKGEFTSGDYEGQQLEGTPEWQLAVSATYRRPIANSLDGFVNVGYRGQWDGFNTSTLIDNLTPLDPVQLVNVRFGIESGPWEIAGEVRNLFDYEYRTLVNPGAVFYNTPLEAGVTLRYRYN